jgi:hypothetical protein
MPVRLMKKPLLVLAVGFCLSLIILAGSLLFLRPPAECPTGYTQQQIHETGCIMGANIGMGPAFGILTSVCVAILTLILAGIMALLASRHPSQDGA